MVWPGEREIRRQGERLHYEWGIEVSYNNFQTIWGTTKSVGCTGGRAKGGGLPSFELIAEGLVVQPAGTLLRVYITPLKAAMTIGIQGEARV